MNRSLDSIFDRLRQEPFFAITMTAPSTAYKTGLMMLLGALLGLFGEAAWAQEGAGPTGTFSKFQFGAFDQYSYNTHVFVQLTANAEFEGALGTTGDSLDIGTVESDAETNVLEKGLHILPPLGWETGWKFDLAFPKGISVGLDYSHLFQTDEESLERVPLFTQDLRFQMDVYYLAVPVRFYAMDPTAPGFTYFFGFSLGRLNGHLLTRRASAEGKVEVWPFSMSSVGAMRIGFEVSGETFGFRYEFMLINAREVLLRDNPFFPGKPGATKLDFSGTLVRLSLLVIFE